MAATDRRRSLVVQQSGGTSVSDVVRIPRVGAARSAELAARALDTELGLDRP